jgi:hypothetical protein
MILFRKSSRYLRLNLPLKHRVRVRRVKMPDHLDGDCCFKNGEFRIRINRNLSENGALDVFIHELSHCLSWGHDDDHGPEWGLAYSLVYRKFLEWLDNRS